MEDVMIQQARAVFTDVWAYYKKCHEPEDTEAFWRSALDDMNAIAKKHNGNRVCSSMLLVTLQAIEDDWKERGDGGKC